MAIRQIRKDGDEILRKISKKVDTITPRILELIEDMKETLTRADGAGLAAVQVGVLRRVILIAVDDEVPTVMINPEILEISGEQCGEEGCLSIPGVYLTVKRPNYVKVKAFNEKMEPFEMEGEELFARAVCHEIDHLNGVLFKDLAEKEPVQSP